MDRELARITNERMMDFGISSDVVSLTEQPLHAVPLFKFQSVTKGEDGTVVDDYTIPHWFNYSFYDPASLWSEERFQPRIRLPDYMVRVSDKITPMMYRTRPQGYMFLLHALSCGTFSLVFGGSWLKYIYSSLVLSLHAVRTKTECFISAFAWLIYVGTRLQDVLDMFPPFSFPR